MADTAISTVHERALKNLKLLLCDKMKPEEPLLIQLEALDVLTSADIQYVKAQKTLLEKSSLIIEYIRKGTERLSIRVGY